MRKNRYFPFGYAMENGTVVPETGESVVVNEIFSLYLAGGSYRSIEEKLSAGAVPYHPHTNHWNKHMVKRILEDRRYLGGKHPPLVELAVFLEVQTKIATKTQSSATISTPYQRKAKTEFVCGECGKGLDSCRLQQKELSCQNPLCTLQGRIFTETSILETLQSESRTDTQFAELKIQQKAELSMANPCEDTLLELSERLASLRFYEILQREKAILLEAFTWRDILQAKRIIIYTDTIQIVGERS